MKCICANDEYLIEVYGRVQYRVNKFVFYDIAMETFNMCTVQSSQWVECFTGGVRRLKFLQLLVLEIVIQASLKENLILSNLDNFDKILHYIFVQADY